MNEGSSKSGKIVLLESIFNVNNQQIFFLILEYPFRRPFFWQNYYFLASIFEPLYILKLCPIFDELTFIDRQI